jgi:hypothetical protein
VATVAGPAGSQHAPSQPPSPAAWMLPVGMGGATALGRARIGRAPVPAISLFKPAKGSSPPAAAPAPGQFSAPPLRLAEVEGEALVPSLTAAALRQFFEQQQPKVSTISSCSDNSAYSAAAAAAAAGGAAGHGTSPVPGGLLMTGAVGRGATPPPCFGGGLPGFNPTPMLATGEPRALCGKEGQQFSVCVCSGEVPRLAHVA